MHLRISTTIAVLAALGIVASQAASAQTTTTAPSTSADNWRMPYQSGFWGHAGASFGQSKLRLGCPSGASCDSNDTAWRLFAGGRFNNAFGLELGVVNYGKFGRGGGDTEGWGLDIPVLLGFPIGRNSSIFAKAGINYSRMEVSGTPGLVQAGKESGWGPRFGLGAQIGLTPQWAIRGDWDTYRVRFPGERDRIDTLTVGAQYNFH